MTDNERWEIEGRTRETLKKLKRTVAALSADIHDYADKLKLASESMNHFLADPVGAGPTGMLKDAYLIHFHHELLSREIERKLTEFREANEKLQVLEKQVAKFD